MSNVQETIDTTTSSQKRKVASNSKSSKAAAGDTPLSEKMRSSLHETVDTLAEKAEAAEKTIRDTAGNSQQALSEKQQQVQESWEASSVRKYAVENPVATAGIVFIAGALFGKFLSRS